MVLNYNDTQAKDVINNCVDGLKLNPITDAIPHAVISSIQPTFEVKRRVCNRSRRGTTLSNATTATIFATPSNQDFYVVSAALSVIKDVTNLATLIRIECTCEGTTSPLCSIAGIAATPDAQTISVAINPPIKVDRNTNIVITSDDGTANIRASGIVTGYVEDAGNNLSV